MEKLYNIDCNVEDMNPLTLAFIGDAVFDLFVRELLVTTSSAKVRDLNNRKVNIVCCRAQAQLANKIIPELSEQEKAIYKRGRNAHISSCPKNSNISDYHSATGLEALIGYLYLEGNFNRIREILQYIA